MAGIAGIVCKNKQAGQRDYNKAFTSMMKKLAYSETQLNQLFSDGVCYAGNVVPIASPDNDHYIKIADLPYHIFIDGLVFINQEEKKILRKKYKEFIAKNDYDFLPYLFDYYNKDFTTHLTGWFNIFIYNENTHEPMLVNDRLGFLPIYYYNHEAFFLFSSKLESILASGLIKNIDFDATTVAEHLVFNYPLSDHTYIKDVYTLPDSSALIFNDSGFSIERYWDLSGLFDDAPLNRKESIETINRGLKIALEKILQNRTDKINFSLTGGWDSRVVLSYLLPDNKQILNAYSFGAPEAEDIWIPEFITENEEFKYTPYRLDQDYLDNEFLKNATDTIIMSNGTRNYKRTHYIYAAKQIAQISDILLTGIFGDEVFKVGKPQGGTVISRNAVNLIESGFDVGSTMRHFRESKLTDLLNTPEKELEKELEARLNIIRKRFLKYRTSGQQYFAFRFTLNLRKYFGNEVNSYNDFVYCYSPYIDYDFLKEFARTKYMVSRYNFTKTSLKQKAQSSWLYYRLTKLNYPALTKYPSSRGFSMKDTRTLKGIYKILFNKLIKKQSNQKIDGFNTKDTDKKFHILLLDKNLFSSNPVFRKTENNGIFKEITDYLSLLYWITIIKDRYSE